MKKILLFLSILSIFKTSFAQNTHTDSIYLNYVSGIGISTNDFNKLLPLITQPGKTNQEKLTLVYYWVYKHIDFDMDKFLKSGSLVPASLTETLQSGKGECYEYNEFIDAACKYLRIPGFNIEGYVKYYGFEPGQSFTQSNHIWYTVNIDGEWKMIDLLWSCGTLSVKGSDFRFKKKLHQEYFLVNPAGFSDTHLPADPIWQFENKPLSMNGFTSKADGVDVTQRYTYINYADSIKAMSKLNPQDMEIQSAIRAYQFNADNPNQLIVVYYNDAVDLVNNPKANRNELIKARNYFHQSLLLISKTKDAGIQSLGPICEKGIKSIENRLKIVKS